MAVAGIESLLPAGTDARSVTYRTTLLTLLVHRCNVILGKVGEQNPLSRWQHGDDLDVALFEVAATIPTRWLPSEGGIAFPIDIPEFIKRVEQEAA